MAPQIVIIDDDPLFRSLLTELADAAGCDVIAEASSLADAELALAANPHLVLLDLHLPDGAGMEVVQRVRRLTTAPITVLTGDDGAAIDELLDSGATCVVNKAEIDLESFGSVLEQGYASEGLAAANN